MNTDRLGITNLTDSSTEDVALAWKPRVGSQRRTHSRSSAPAAASRYQTGPLPRADARPHLSGADAIATVEQKANDLLAQADAHRDLSASLAIEEA
jgi:hypothetical protein